MPKVSVVMPAYNAEKYIGEAIESILSQTFKDFELIIVDDGSTDSTADIIKSYNDSRIIYLKNENNMKISDTLNRGISQSTGKYIARMDADDIAMPERLEKQVEFLDKHNEIYVLGTAIEVFGDDFKSYIRTFSTTHDKLFADMLFSSCMAHPTVMMRRSLFSDEGFSYNPEFNGMEDYVLFWQIALKHKLATLCDCLLQYRIHDTQITQNYTAKELKKHITFKKIQISNINANLTENESTAFILACEKKPNFCKFTFEEILSAYKKILKACNGNSFLKEIFTINLIDFSKAYMISFKILKKYLDDDFSKMRLLKHKLRTILRPPYIKLLQMQKIISAYPKRKKLKNKNFTIISNNCWAGFVYQKYGLEYSTPTVGLLILGRDYVKFCADLKYYISQELKFITFEESKYYSTVKEYGPYPVAKLGDIEVYFMHYKTPQEAEQKWDRRCKRINWDNIIYKLSKRETFSNEIINDFLSLNLKNSLCFTPFESDKTFFIPEIDTLVGDETPVIEKFFDTTEYLNSI